MEEKTDQVLFSSPLAVIGCGRLGSVLVEAVREKLQSISLNILVYDRNQEKIYPLLQKPGVAAAQSARDAASKASTVILSVKPKDILSVLSEIKGDLQGSKILISVAAGISVASMEGVLGKKEEIVRVMPNICSLIGQGMTGIFTRSPQGKSIATEIFSALGETLIVDKEEDLDIVTGLSASGPAFIFSVIEAMAEGGVKMGLSREKAMRLSIETALGGAALLKALGKDPQELIEMVASPGGTTVAGLQVLKERGMKEILMATVQASVERASQIRKGN